MDSTTIKRMQDVLDAKGVKVTTAVLKEAVEAAVAPPPAPDDPIPVSQGMIAAGRDAWVLNPKTPPRVLLPILYRAMEQKRKDEKKAGK